MADPEELYELKRRLALAESRVPELQAGQSELRESEARYRDLFDRMAEGFAVCDIIRDQDGRAFDLAYRELNQSWGRLTGLDRSAMIGRRFLDFFPTVEAERWIPILARVADSGEPATFEQYTEALDRWLEVSAYPRDRDHVSIFFRNVTAAKKAEAILRESEERQAFLLKLSDAFRAKTDPEAIGGLATRMLAEQLKVDRSFICRYSQEEGRGWIGPEYRSLGLPALSGEYRLVDFPEGMRRLKTAPLIISDVLRDPSLSEADRQFMGEMLGLRAMLAVVLRKRETNAIWCLVAATTQPREWTDGELRFLEDVAERTWAAMERASAEAALRQSEEKHRSLFETMGQGYCEIELIRDSEGHPVDQHYLELNPAFERIFGIPVANAIGRTASEVFPGHEEWTRMLGKVAETGVSERIEYPLASTGRWYEVFAYSRPSDRVAMLYTDVTERKRAEALLRESEERQAFLLKLSDTLRTEADASGVANRALEMLRDHLRLDRCYITYYRPAEDLAEFPYQIGNDTVPPLPATLRLSDFPDAYEQVQDRTLVIDDDSERPGLSEAERASSKALGMRAMVASTVRRGEKRPLSSMVAVSSRPRHWSAAEITLVEETAERTWAAIERVRAEAALRDSEQNLHGVANIVPDLLWYSEPGGLSPWYNDRWLEYTGQTLEQAIGWGWVDAIHPDDREVSARRYREAVEQSKSLEQEHRIRRHTGEYRWFLVRSEPTRDELGRVVRMYGAATDIQDQRLAMEALRESEERFRQFANASAAGLWMRDAKTLEMEFVSSAIATIYGVGPDALLGGVEHWAALIVPDDRNTAVRHLEEARQGKSVVHEFRIRRPSDGAFRWIRNADFPLRDGEAVARIGGIAEDVSEAKLAIEHQAVLLAELQHRVRNIMAMTRSVTQRTARNAQDVADYAALMSGRLMSLARTQALLTRADNVSVDLESLLHAELSAQANEESQYSLSGPKVDISPKAAEVLSLSIHELTTNALKYGAFSVAEGKIDVVWHVSMQQGSPVLRLQWTETRPPIANWTPPTRRGFGSELVERRVPYELDGKGKVELTPEGARVSIAFPLQPGASILETSAPIRKSVYGGSIDMSGEQLLAGLRILVVEDDYLLAYDTQSALESAGATVVGPFKKEGEAIEAIHHGDLNAALTDINLGKGPSFEIARVLKQAQVPFAFLTGYDREAIPEEFAELPRFVKPIDTRRMVRELSNFLQTRSTQAGDR